MSIGNLGPAKTSVVWCERLGDQKISNLTLLREEGMGEMFEWKNNTWDTSITIRHIAFYSVFWDNCNRNVRVMQDVVSGTAHESSSHQSHPAAPHYDHRSPVIFSHFTDVKPNWGVLDIDRCFYLWKKQTNKETVNYTFVNSTGQYIYTENKLPCSKRLSRVAIKRAGLDREGTGRFLFPCSRFAETTCAIGCPSAAD